MLLAERLACPVWVGRDRCCALRSMIDKTSLDAVLSDDGLQHYHLARDFEICVIDAWRGLGNAHCLPVGPLREAPTRLRSVDFVLANGGALAGGLRCDGVMQVQAVQWRNLHDGSMRAPTALDRGNRVHAVAGIGNPAGFFRTLRALGLEPIEHAFADHHRFTQADLDFADDLAVVMTEKDAVKCRRFATPDWWSLQVAARIPESLVLAINHRIATTPWE